MRAWPALDVRSGNPGPDADRLWELLLAALTDFDLAAIDDNTADNWRAFFRTAKARDAAAIALSSRYPTFTFDPVDVPDEDWAARSQESLGAVRVGGIIVAPPWEIGTGNSELGTRNWELGPRKSEPLSTSEFRVPSSELRSPSSALTIVIQPSMGFGTGHHATTRLCLDHLQRLDLRGRSVIDVGTGSGVLAIAASRLGATHVLGLDDDPDAIQSARENLDLNPGAEVTLGVADLRRTTLRPFDVVLGNLTGGLLIAAAVAVQRLAAPDGRLVLGGFMMDEQKDVLASFAECDLAVRSQEDDWVCVTLRRRR